ncbi:MAG TPA: pyridoxamine 5'-phosphate oxidase family protein [Devosiaceae bacterium]|jgi:general stress protein 26
MAHEESHGKTPAELEERVWELADKIKFAMFTTWDGSRQGQWPLSATADRDADAIYFLVAESGGKYRHLESFPNVTLGFADTGGNKYVVINGTAALSNDRAKIKELWSPFAKAWWDSADDPDICLLTVKPDRAELWDAPNKIVATAVMLTAAVTGAKPKVGDHGAVRM